MTCKILCIGSSRATAFRLMAGSLILRNRYRDLDER
jgi:hypothetical protein